MSEPNLSTRQLRAFVELAELRSFTRAAARCHLSQPAFSALIRSLEQAVGARLFDRTTRTVGLTPEGSLFLDGAQRLLQDMQATVEDLGAHVALRRGRVSLAALPALAAGWLPAVLQEFRGRYPDIELDIADALSEECVERVRAGRADFALAAVRANAPELATEPFCTDRFHLVCRRDHPLAARRRIAIGALAGHHMVSLARSSSVRQLVEAALRPLQMRSVMELEQLSTVAGMVRAGLGITVVPSLTLFHFEHADLVTRPLGTPALRREIFLIRRSDRALSSAAQALLALVMRRKPGPR
ncbi:LysR family transcriptional regulator [Ideonella sp. BN130291]|uniref:LysR family transcriptional regulator n=1 Tax=Ideonella sp. BN130291 TaxID=3112940 RepID=UPI002E26E149|nr:LysR family transcriptional regulator [Ideonella sp. BN130291]